jgi:CcmD family protein
MNLTIFLTILLQSGIDDPNRFNNYLMLAYGVIWVMGLGYVVSLIIRQRNLQQDLRLMRQLLQEDEETAEK